MTNPELIADIRNPWPILSPATSFTGDNGRRLHFCKRDYKWVRAVAVFHRSDETWKLTQDFLRCVLDVFVEWHEHRAICLGPLVNFVVFLS